MDRMIRLRTFPDGQTFTLEVSSDMTVYQVKQLIFETKGIKCKHIGYAQPLDDNDLLPDHTWIFNIAVE